MASKVCPVCKTFSSTSNTTLNAHIDQCLAADSTSIGDMNESRLTQHRIKPRMKRSMVDIYATAPRCTLEELDRRNGSNWAADLSSPSTAAKANAGEKRQRLSGVDLEGTDDESPVYIDSNGKKILILSKISSATISTAVDGPSKLIKNNGKECKIISFDEKNRSKSSKHRKIKSRNTKLCSLKADEVRVSGEQEHDAEKNYEKEESLSQFLKARDGINSTESGTLRKWVGSKRTCLLKKVSVKDGHRGLGCSSSMTVNPVMRNSMHSGDSSPRRSSVLSNPSERVVSSPKNLKAGIPTHDTGCGADSRTRLSPLPNDKTPSRRGGCLSKLPQSSGMIATSPRSKRVEVNVGQAQNSDNLPKTDTQFENGCRIAMDGKQSCIPSDELVVEPSFDTMKSKLYGKRSASKKPRVHRSISKMEEKVMALPLNVEEHYECAENLSGRFQSEMTHNLNGSSDQARPEVEEVIDQLSLGGAGESTSKTRREASRFLGEGEPKPLEEASHSDSENHGSDVDGNSESNVRASLQNIYSIENITEDIDDETDSEAVLVNADTVDRTYLNKGVGVSISKSSKTMASEFYNSANSMEALPNSLSSTQVHNTCAWGTEKRMPLVQQKLCDSQLAYSANEVSRIGKNPDMESVINSQLVGISSDCKCTRCRNDPQYVPALVGTPFQRLWDMNFENMQEKLSLSSSKMLCTEDRHLVVDRDSSESPVSATSSISHPIIARSDSRYDVGLCAKPSEAEDKLISFSGGGGCAEPMTGYATSSPFMMRAESAERLSLDRENPKVTTISSTDDQLCHCLWRKSFSFGVGPAYQEPQLLKQRTQESSVMPRVYNSNTGPEIFTKQDSFTVSRNSDMNPSICESPRDSVSMHSSPDAVHRLTRHENFSPVRTFSQVHDVEPTSNPVLSLRLMGKNLMVVNKDEERFVNQSQPPLGTSNACADTKNMTPFGFYTGSVPNQDCFSSQIMSPKGSVVSDQDSCNSRPHFFHDDVSKSFTNHSGSETPQRPQQLVGTQNQMDIGGVDYSLVWHGLKSRSDMETQQKKHTRRLVAPAHLQYLNPVSAAQMVGHPTREVIVIDDSPESEAASGTINTKYAGGLKGSQPSPVGVLPPTSTYPNISQLSSFSCHPALNPFSRLEPQIGTKPHFSVPHLGGAHASPLNWGNTSKSPGVTLQNPFTSTSSFACHRNQAMYHSPSFP
ncbi:Hapless protein [Thalictrum thalictroides]|uniref:Hapless protein n=1 Tax=Thalictrum thalictroides TaxID=46969 RepID=A0A7J6WVT0_THATH|nr:Hapless protein [Thalictrum thalictroides]